MAAPPARRPSLGPANEPVPLTLVELETAAAANARTTTTDSTGAFCFDGVPAGVYEEQVTPSAGYLAPEPVQFALSDDPNEAFVFMIETSPSTMFLPLIAR